MPTFKGPFSLFPAALSESSLYIKCHAHSTYIRNGERHRRIRLHGNEEIYKNSPYEAKRGHLWNKSWRNLFMNSGSCCKQPTGNHVKSDRRWEWEKFAGYEGGLERHRFDNCLQGFIAKDTFLADNDETVE